MSRNKRPAAARKTEDRLAEEIQPSRRELTTLVFNGGRDV